MEKEKVGGGERQGETMKEKAKYYDTLKINGFISVQAFIDQNTCPQNGEVVWQVTNSFKNTNSKELACRLGLRKECYKA